MHPALESVLQLVLPVDCVGCGRPGPQLCAVCRAALAPDPRVRTAGGLRVTSALDYERVARDVLIAFKNEGATALAAPLATALTAAVTAAVGERTEVALVPMPRTRRSAVERGYDPVRLLLRRAGLPQRDLLRLARRPGDQLRLGRAARFANVDAGMRALPGAAGLRILLVDDVVTTGATLQEAARAVRAAGGVVAGAATLASTPSRSFRARPP